ncbi:ABC transporter permease [Paenibacillus sp. FSL R7-269]|uniref:ABC transporter permease n=1 Tax=Paenibacillus sp. FSL R7-269 TaxID=1226755 RepID=UPI00056D3B3F|nr:ABC transporter permease [Paenibacillus sp. FSL R7-269]
MKYRYLLIQLVSRDFKVKYKRSLLGVLWSLLNPLMTMLILTMVFSTLFKSNIPNFPVYFLCGSVMFNFFAESTNLALGSIYSNASLIKKVYFPKYMFPFSKNIFSLINLFTSFIAVIIVMIATRTGFHVTMLLSFIPIIYLFIFSLGISLILSCAAVFFRDLAHLYGIFITALNFLTPVFYPIDILPERIRPLVEMNPLTQAIQMLRQLILYSEVPDFYHHLVLFLTAVVTFLLGVFVFYKKQDRFIMYI